MKLSKKQAEELEKRTKGRFSVELIEKWQFTHLYRFLYDQELHDLHRDEVLHLCDPNNKGGAVFIDSTPLTGNRWAKQANVYIE
jgi:hypothetical protein